MNVEEDEMNPTTMIDEPRELAHRANDGLEVTLFWRSDTDSLVVSVIDEKTGDRFVLPAEGATALDVFYHPYAHAARRGIEYRAGLREEQVPEEATCA